MDLNHPPVTPTIRNHFSPEESNRIISTIEVLIQSEPRLSRRTPSELRKIIGASGLNALFIGGELGAFIFVSRLSHDLIEIHGLYVLPAYRGRGYARSLIRFSTQDPSQRYFAATFLVGIRDLLARDCGFVATTLSALSWREHLSFLAIRLKPHRIAEVIRHRRTSQIFFLVKDCLC